MKPSWAVAADDTLWEHRYADVNGIRLHYVEAGAGPLVLLLHGFPDFWYGWRRQIAALSAAGFRVVAPDLRGYGLSAKPTGVRAYGMSTLVKDVRGLVESLDAGPVGLVGHDWGAAIAWAFSMRHPELLHKLVVLNGPHPARMREALRRPTQLARSSYMLFFQLPRLPECMSRLNRHSVLLGRLDRGPPATRLTADERAAYRDAYDQPGALTAMLNYYRAMFRRGTSVEWLPIRAEVLVLWGERDPYFDRALAQPDERWVPRARVEYLPAGHFLQHERPQAVSRHLIEFLGSPSSPSG